MEIKFITNREDHLVTFPKADLSECIEYCLKLDLIGFDTENSSLRPIESNKLLVQLGDENITYVIDATSVDISPLKALEHKTFLGQNLKYDYSIFKVQGIEYKNLWDIMIAEQVLGRGSGRRNSLDQIILRRVGVKATYEKDTRNEFINRGKNMVFTDKNIIYAAEDIKFLKPIYNSIQHLIDKNEMRFLLEEIEFPLISVVANCELRGVNLNVEKWKENIFRNKKIKYETEVKLDEEFRRLRDCCSHLFDEKTFLSMKNGKFDRKRNPKPEVFQTDIFGGEKVIKEKATKSHINWSSSTQVLGLINKLNLPVPVDKYGKETIGKAQLEQYKLNVKGQEVYKFTELLLDLSNVKALITNFGYKHIESISPITGKLHTIYSQASAETGRFKSGNMDEGFFNSQNIPAELEYRSCFYATPGYKIISKDLSSAELVILGSNANDKKLLEFIVQDKDLHSYLANAAYKNILDDIRKKINSRKGGWDCLDVFSQEIYAEEIMNLLSGAREEEKISYEQARKIIEDFIQNGESITISKKTYGWIRENFKSVVYGLMYGATAKRIAEVLGINMNYSEIVLKTLRKELPDTFKYLDEVAAKAIKDGYVILSNRTKSRRWFKEVLERNKFRTPISSGRQNEIEREAKNAPIQGTNADIIKESMVKIANEIKVNNWDAHLLMTVHDELVYEFHESLEDFFPDFVAKTLTETSKLYLSHGASIKSAGKVSNYWSK